MPGLKATLRWAGVAVALAASVLVGTASRASAQVSIDVMTFNIRTSNGRDGDNAWPNRKALVAETIERFAPHVVGLQEALNDQVEHLASALPDYRWFGIDRGLNGGQGLSEYTPIFYRHAELSPVESGTFWLSSTPDTPAGRAFAGGFPGSSRGPGSITWRPTGRSTSSTPTSRSGGVSGKSTRPR